jgi:hypothetical protein
MKSGISPSPTTSFTPGFMEVVNEAWNGDINHVEPCQRLFHKLKKTGAKLRKWSKKLFSKAKPALQVILHLDIAQKN